MQAKSDEERLSHVIPMGKTTVGNVHVTTFENNLSLHIQDLQVFHSENPILA